MAKGLWVHASYMNHSCVPNTMRSFVGDMLISRATRDIAAGEELFQQYVPVKPFVDVRNAIFSKSWGFECACEYCSAESQRVGAQALERRKELVIAIERTVGKRALAKGARDSGGIVPESAMRAIDKLARQLEGADLHDPAVYGGEADDALLPRLTLIYATNWLSDAHLAKKNWAKALRYTLKVVRNLGFRVPADDAAVLEGKWDPRDIYSRSGTAALMTIHVVTALRKMAEVYEALGQAEMARKCVEAAEFGYMLVTGFHNDLAMLNY